jgi:hypothetical protein
MKHSHNLWAIVLFVIFGLTFGAAEEKRFEKKFSVSPGGTLTVNTDIASVTVTGGSTNEVSIVGVMKGSERDISAFSLDAQSEALGVKVVGKMDKSIWSFWRHMNLNVTLTITVPESYNVRVGTSGGDVAVGGVKGTINGETSGGDIHVQKIVGPVTMETSGGDVVAEEVKGNVHLETSGGDMRVRDVEGDVDVETSGGNVKVVKVQGKVVAETSGGNMEIAVIGVNKGIHVETSGGNIDLSVEKSVKADVDVGTSGGVVSCDLRVTVQGKVREHSIRGTLNGGGNLIYAHTSGGNITIRPAD